MWEGVEVWEKTIQMEGGGRGMKSGFDETIKVGKDYIIFKISFRPFRIVILHKISAGS